MSVACRLPYTLLKQIQTDLTTLTQTVRSLQTQSDKDDTLHTLQSTVDSIGAVLCSAETSTSNLLLHPTFMDCKVGTLSFLDNFGTRMI